MKPSLLERLAPPLFVLLWSTGFIVARYGTRDSGPFTFLTVRLAIAAVVLWLVASVSDAPQLTRDDVRIAGVVGVGMHAMYLGGVFFAVSRGLPSGVSALIAALHPVFTAFGSHFALRERLSNRQWVGIGLGLLGVVCVLIERSHSHRGEVTAAALVAMAISVLGMAGGTMLQRSHGRAMPLLRGTAVQYASACVVLGVGAIAHEKWQFRTSGRLWFSIAWAVGVLSIAAVLLMLLLLSKHAATRVSSLFFLTPALSAIEAAILFRERLGILAGVGLVVALAGVWMTTSNQR